jgi:hypothetical protein
MTNKEIDNKLYLARICHLSGLPEETIKYVEEIIKLKNGNITEEERNLLFSSFKTLINFRRDSWRTVHALESKELKNKSSLLPRVTGLKASLTEEIKNYVNKAIELIDNNLLKNAVNNELKVMYSKIKGDYTRYIIEIIPKENEEEINALKEKAGENYKMGLNLCDTLSNLNTTKVGLMLNYTVFLYEIMKDYKTAYIIANDAYEKTMKSIKDDNHDLNVFKDLNKLINLLKDNISKWSETVIQENNENAENEELPPEKIEAPSS